MSGILERLLHRDRAVVVAALTGLSVVSWSYVLLGVGSGAAIHGSAEALIAPTGDATGSPADFGLVFAMWAVMMMAMMLPGAAPMILLFATISRRGTPGTRTSYAAVALFTVGYVVVWIGFSVVATTLQATTRLAVPVTAGTSVVIAASALIAAGFYQLTSLKAACLRRCRSPLEFVLQHWQPGARGALLMGLLHGMFCLGCCWMLMVLLFVSGAMNIQWIAALTILVLAEKTLPWPDPVRRITGAVLTGWGAIVLWNALVQ